MSAAPATKGRRIGEIVLELGFASEADVAKATLEHERTGQPHGNWGGRKTNLTGRTGKVFTRPTLRICQSLNGTR